MSEACDPLARAPNVSRIGASKPAETSALRRATIRSEVEPSGSPMVKRLNRLFDHPGRHDLAGGIDDAADGALGSNRVPLRRAWIDALQMMAA
jgi:hypothetical protein